ncbi:MAG: single-stranded-DNA-specific exonuclease RecJ [Ignavibacteria bacterium]
MKQRYNWKILNCPDEFSQQVLVDDLNIHPSLAKVLVLREIDSYRKAKRFFKPTLEDLYDPYLLTGMRDAVKRIIKALTENEKIMIYGDYDVDGTNAAAMLYLFLSEIGGNIQIYIPNRFKDGYGISKSGIDEAIQNEVKLIISVDCGITAIEETEYAKNYGIDLIICDHHEPGEVIPKALAVLDPLKPGCPYPYKYLSGAGVTFKLMQAISDSIGMKDLPFKYLDFVAVAGAADIVPLTDENRILVKFGLEKLNIDPRPGFKALIEKAGLKLGNISSSQIVFGLAPRINAVGRLGDANRAIQLLLSKDYEEALHYAEILDKENRNRREIDEEILNEAIQKVENEINFDEDIAIILHKEDWHLGVIGIVASRLVEKFYRPSILLTDVDGILKGSARSIAEFNLYEALKECEDVLIQFGGHKAAAGLSIHHDKVDEFKKRFNEVAKRNLTPEQLIPTLEIEAVVELNSITPKFRRILDRFSPFGPQNMKPVFLTEKVEIFDRPRVSGSNHLFMKVRKNGSSVFDVIGYNLGNFAKTLLDLNGSLNNTYIDIVYTIESTTINDMTFPLLNLKDFRISQK